MGHTLVLNADYSPISVLPMSHMMWTDTMKALCLGNIHVVHTYENWVVNSPRMSYAVPSVAIVREYKRIRRSVAFTDDIIKLRDLYTCQYCNERFPERKLTMDHVVPKSHGGPYHVTNLVAACESCNTRRGNNTRIQPRRAPYKPTYRELAEKIKQFPIAVPHASWVEYIGWNPDMVRVCEPCNMPGYNVENSPLRVMRNLVHEPTKN